MSWLHGLRHRLRAVLHPRAYERELQDEMRFHVELDAMQQRDADAARRRFGNRTWFQEETRRMTWLASFDVLRQDVGYAWRSIRRSPGFTSMVVLTLALGLGVNAATFSLLDRLYLRAPDGVRDPGQVRRIWFQTSAERSGSGKAFASPSANYMMYQAVTQASGNARNFAVFGTDGSLYFGTGNKRPRVRAVFASASYFRVLDLRPALGRLYTAAEDSLGNGAKVIVVGDRFWRTTLGADSAIVGTQLRVENASYTVVGVLEPGFAGLDLQQFDIWMPIASIPTTHWVNRTGGGKPWWESVNAWMFNVIERVGPIPDVGFEQRATRSLRDLNRRLFPRAPDTLAAVLTSPLAGFGGPGTPGQDMIISTRLGAVAFIVLIIACANVVNLLLARAVHRRREIAVRLAVGISRSRLIRLLTAETMLLALLAGAAAILAAWWGGSLLRSLLLPEVTWYESVLHWRVVAFVLVTALVAGLVAGIIPAVQASNPELSRSLKENAREGSIHRSRLRNTMVVVQAALSMTLLVGAALFVRSLSNVQALDIGFDSDRITFGWVQFQGEDKVPDAVVGAKLQEIAAALDGKPGVETTALAVNVPMRGIRFLTFFWGPGAKDSSASLRSSFPTLSPVTASFFDVVGMRLVRGSVFEDRKGAPGQVMVNEEMAGLLWPREEPLGQCMRFESRTAPCYTVVGIVENARRRTVIEDATAQYYLPLSNMPAGSLASGTLIVRTRPDASRAATSAIRAELERAFPTGIITVKGMHDELEPEYRPWRLGATLFTCFGLLALLVALIGIYSTVAYGVTQRTHEFGVRVALGARMNDVVRQVIGEGLRVVLVGVIAGIALALAAGKLIAALLYGVKASDPTVMLAVSGVLLIVAALAALVPAWRAARVDPVTALRAD